MSITVNLETNEIEVFVNFQQKGDKGDTGAVGATGPKGDKGDIGITGAKGDTGATGAKGETGSQGIQGIQGEKGNNGDVVQPKGVLKPTDNPGPQTTPTYWFAEAGTYPNAGGVIVPTGGGVIVWNGSVYSASGLAFDLTNINNTIAALYGPSLTSEVNTGQFVNLVGTFNNDANYRAVFFAVTAGKKYRIKGQITAPAISGSPKQFGALAFYITKNGSGYIAGSVQLQSATTAQSTMPVYYDLVVTAPVNSLYICISQNIALDNITVSEVLQSSDLKDYIDFKNANVLGYLSSVDLARIDQDGVLIFNTNSASSNAAYKISYFPVTAGRKYRVKGQFTNPSPSNVNLGVYCFYTGTAYGTGIAGTMVVQSVALKTYDIVITAPATAQYIGISQRKDSDTMIVNEIIELQYIKPAVDKNTLDIATNKTLAESNFDLLSKVVAPNISDNYVVPNYGFAEADINYQIHKYSVVVGKTYRLRAQITSKAVTQGTMGAYCFYKSNDAPVTGGITLIPQLTTRTFDLRLTIPADTAYIGISFKKNGGDYNSISEVISASRANDAVSDIISCWGDSNTWGSAPEDNVTWVQRLQTKFGTKLNLINCAVGGESYRQIAARQGGVAAYNSVEFTLPADATQSVQVGAHVNFIYDGFWKSSKDNGNVALLIQGESGRYSTFKTVNPCYVDGIECTLTLTKTSDNPLNGTYSLKRNQPGTANRVIPVGTPLFTNGAKNLKQKASIIWFGTNDANGTGVINVPDMIDWYKRCISYADTSKVLVIGVYGGTGIANMSLSQIESMEAQMFSAFGLQYFNIRKYCITNALSDAGITPTSADIIAISQGKCPPSLLADTLHPNAVFSQLIANKTYEILTNMGV